jgi:endonuclease-3
VSRRARTAPAARRAAGRGARARARRAPRRPPRPDPAAVKAVLRVLARRDPHPRCALAHADAYELTVATILSAQCTDVRVNTVTPAFFARYPTPADLARADRADVEELIRTTGFFRNKAKNLVGMARRLVDEYGGEVPRGMEALLTLPGVARKTANVVRGECFGLADGVVVDTHVARIATRLGFTRERDPVKIERDLMELVPRRQWIAFSHRLIRFGRTVCDARRPRCSTCPLARRCPRIGVERSA